MQERANYQVLEQELYSLRKVIEGLQMDKEMLMKQGEFYKNEISGGKAERKELKRMMKEKEKEGKKIEDIKNENGRLKEDIKRMQVIIN